MEIIINLESSNNIWEILSTLITLIAVGISLYVVIEEKVVNKRKLSYAGVATFKIIKYYMQQIENFYSSGKTYRNEKKINEIMDKINNRIDFIASIGYHNYSKKRQNEIANFILLTDDLYSLIESSVFNKIKENEIIGEDTFAEIYSIIDFLIFTYEDRSLISDEIISDSIDKLRKKAKEKVNKENIDK